MIFKFISAPARRHSSQELVHSALFFPISTNYFLNILLVYGVFLSIFPYEDIIFIRKGSFDCFVHYLYPKNGT